jgi:hypothetical protein
LPVIYKGLRLDCGYRVDLIVAETVVVELKTVDHLAPVHDAQLLTYLRLGGWKLGLLINFNVALLRNGIHRRVLGLDQQQTLAGSLTAEALRRREFPLDRGFGFARSARGPGHCQRDDAAVAAQRAKLPAALRSLFWDGTSSSFHRWRVSNLASLAHLAA